MATLDSLPGDQRAVLQLVLGRGRSYADIARMLSIAPDAVRGRALSALDALGPQTGVEPAARAQIGDYLLGQLPDDEADAARERLATSPPDRAWARVLSSELASLASSPLPEIPVDGGGSRAGASSPAAVPVVPPPAPVEPFAPPAPAPVPEPTAALGADATSTAAPAGGSAADPPPAAPPPSSPGGPPRSSRLGGLVVIGGVVVVVIVVLIVVLSSGGGHHRSAGATKTDAAAGSTTTSATSSTAAKVIAQINLTATAAGSKAAGIAEVLREGSTNGIALVAQNMTPNSTKPPNAYAVWLYNSPTDATILGFVNPGVGSNGKLSTAGALPSNASHYKQLVVTLETTGSPKKPGPIVLQGNVTAGL